MTFIQWFGAIWLTLVIGGASFGAAIYAWAATVERFEFRFREAERLRIAAKLRSDAYWFGECEATMKGIILASLLATDNVATTRDAWRQKRRSETGTPTEARDGEAKG